jgi:hypothetical protein
MTYIWNRVEKVPSEHTPNITKSFNEWLKDKNEQLKTADLNKQKSIKNSIRQQTISYEDAMRSINL